MRRPSIRFSRMKNPALTIGTATAAALAVSVAGGTTGAALLWFTHGYGQPSGLLIDWLIILVVWPLTAWLSCRLFLHKVMDGARRDLVSAIRAEQDRTSKAYRLSWQFELARRGGKQLPHPPDTSQELAFWFQQNVEGRAPLFSPSHQSSSLLMVMEEYEILFPETRRVRAQLRHRMTEIDRVYPPLATAIFDEGGRDAAIEQLQQRLPCDLEYFAVLEDLRRHIQNATFSVVTGRTVPPRIPKDKSFSSFLSKRADGLLDISANGVSWPGGDDLTP